jgi:DNA-binding PadR family transcriptional regulator
VRTALVLLLADEPRNGYQLMQAIEELSGGRWRPSPGSVYPTLAQLEDEGLIRSTETDGNKLFELTDTGRQHLEERREQSPPWEDNEEPESFTDLRDQMRRLVAAARQVAEAGKEDQVARAAQAIAEARRTLYRILAEDDEAAS